MESQMNGELPNVGGNFSNQNFETVNLSNESLPMADKFIDTSEARDRAFSAVEKFQQNFEAEQTAPQIQVVEPVQSVPVLPQVQSGAPQVVASSPAIAKDIDLMEDEWVRDLKKMILETKDDPFVRQIRFKEMQVDYLKKRYNRIINGGK